MPTSRLSKVIVTASLGGAARQSLSNLLSLAVIDSAVPLGEHVLLAFGFDSAKEPPPPSARHARAATAGATTAMAAWRSLMFRPPSPASVAQYSPACKVLRTVTPCRPVDSVDVTGSQEGSIVLEQQLRGVPFFRNLQTDALSEIAARLRLGAYTKGTVVFRR